MQTTGSFALRNAKARHALFMAIGVASACLVGPVAGPAGARPSDSGQGASDLLVVDCLLPPTIQRLGNSVTYLRARKAVKTSAAVMFMAFSLWVLMATSYCFKWPPQVFTSTTPGMPESWRFTIQSWMVRSSVSV